MTFQKDSIVEIKLSLYPSKVFSKYIVKIEKITDYGVFGFYIIKTNSIFSKAISGEVKGLFPFKNMTSMKVLMRKSL